MRATVGFSHVVRCRANTNAKRDLRNLCFLELEAETRMTKIKVNKVIDKALESPEEEDASPAFKGAIRYIGSPVISHEPTRTKQYQHSNNPPSQDPNRKRSVDKRGVASSRLRSRPSLKTSRSIEGSLPRGQCHHVGLEARQVFDVEIASA